MTSIQKTTTRLLMAGIVCAATLAGCASSETRPPARAHATLPPLVAITETMTTTTPDERDEPPITTAVIPTGPTPARDNAGAAPLPTETTVELAGRTRPRLTPSVETSTVSIWFCRVDMLELTASILGGKPPVYG